MKKCLMIFIFALFFVNTVSPSEGTNNDSGNSRTHKTE